MQVLACAACEQKLGKVSSLEDYSHLRCLWVDPPSIIFRQTTKSPGILKGVCSKCKMTVLYKRLQGLSVQPELELITNRLKTSPDIETPSPPPKRLESDLNIPKNPSNPGNSHQTQQLLNNIQGNWEFRSAVQDSVTKRLSLLEVRLTKAQSLLQKLLHSGVRPEH